MFELDHIAVAGETLEEAATRVEERLGVPLETGGEHREMGTHNRLLSLGPGLYLEAIAINPAADAPDRPRWFDLDCFKGPARLKNGIARTDDLTGALSCAPLGMGIPIDFQRGQFRWAMAVPETGKLPYDNVVPALMRWDCAVHPSDALTDRNCRLRRLLIQHPQADELLDAFPALVALPLVEIEAFERPALVAEIDTPHGLRFLD